MSIEFINIDFSYPSHKNVTLPLFRSLRLSIPSGKITAIVGPSGCGKSTLLKLIAGLLMPEKGTIQVEGSTPELCRKKGKFGLVFQNADLLPWRTVARNVQLPFELQKKPVDKAAVMEMLGKIGLVGWSEKYPYQLSGGMQQRVALARAFIAKPGILLLDEPFSQLDELLRFELLFYIQNYASVNNATVVFITHDVSEAVLAADMIYIVSGKINTEIEKFDVLLERPRSIETANQAAFHDIVSRVRTNLKTQKPNN